MNIGEKIKQLRQNSGMTQEALARRLNISPQAVSKWEQSTTAPDITLLGDIADCFSVSTDYLLGAGRYRGGLGHQSERARLAAIYEERGIGEDFQNAARAYEEVFLRGEPLTEDYTMYGWLHELRAVRDLELAARYYEKAIELGEKGEESWLRAHVQLSRVLSMRGRSEEMVNRWKGWLDREPDNVQACLAVIWGLFFAGRPEEALPYMEQAERLAPEDPFVMTAIGDVLGGVQGLGRYEEAIAYWDRALQLDDDFGDARYSKAYAYESLGQLDKAISEYQEICAWLRRRGNLELETQYPQEKIQELMERVAEGK